MNSDDELSGLVDLGDKLYSCFNWRNEEVCSAKERRKVFYLKSCCMKKRGKSQRMPHLCKPKILHTASLATHDHSNILDPRTQFAAKVHKLR
jgi:hypothetical protein